MNRSNQEIEDMYLDWFNNSLSTEKFREYYGLGMAEAENIIDQGRKLIKKTNE